jgi:hypothetical protein
MLLYDVAYLAHTQAVDVPLAGAGDALGNLWAVCCAPELGRRSHETGAPAGAWGALAVGGMGVAGMSGAGAGAGAGLPSSEGTMPGMGALLASELGVGTGATQTHGFGPGIITAPGLGARFPSTVGALGSGGTAGLGFGTGIGTVPRVLPPPTPASFPLDFAQVLQATAAGPRRTHAHGSRQSSESQAQGHRPGHVRSSTTGSASSSGSVSGMVLEVGKEKEREREKEKRKAWERQWAKDAIAEEDEWDLVDVDDDDGL